MAQAIWAQATLAPVGRSGTFPPWAAAEMGGSSAKVGVVTADVLASEAAEVGLACHPRGGQPSLGYGTAGFRAAAGCLDHVFYRMGILAAIRSKALGGRVVGVMVTASHNPERDNGVKLVEPMGEMLPVEWEAHATALANAHDDNLAAAIAELMSSLGVDATVRAEVVVGRDTRSSSPSLALAVCDGVGVLRPAVSRSLGLATTPQLHYVVRCENTSGGYGVPSLGGYQTKLVEAYKALVKSAPASKRYQPRLTVDCANGVGAVPLRNMLPQLKEAGLEVELLNDAGGALNEGCGADFVKTKQSPPSGADLASGRRFVSVDGDADRVVYYFSAGGSFRLLDGDRIALLLSHYMALQLKEAGIEDLRLGLVQTAYANGASTACAVKALGEANVLCAKTGVKHCHHTAMALDVGTYFEANGHGTVLFSNKFLERVTAVAKQDGAPGAAASRLLGLRHVINEAVGDAISGILAVEAVLQLLDWSCEEWLAMYSDLPNCQVKVVVADRSAFETTNVERTCVKPEGLQAEIDKLVAEAPCGRSFVRPSGTEDVVRVYAEAQTSEALIKLGQAVVDVVYDRAGGVGTKPHVS
uniref:Phosphoacetylglucosamine mutase n=1 Tax=Alexandrium monilatum TaxID=311494 RepID=A0A7S4USW1_9DINO